MNGTKSSSTSTPSSSQTKSLKALYRQATSSFLVRDYSSTTSSILSAQSILNSTTTKDPSAWVTSLEQDIPPPPTFDLERKLQILETTLLATLVADNPPPLPPGTTTTTTSTPPPIHPLANLPPTTLIPLLWSRFTSPSPSPSIADAHSPGIFASPSTAFVHPSLVISLSLASLKLDQPRLGRQILEAWFGSLDERLERILVEEAERVDWAGEMAIEGGMSQSVTGLKSQEGGEGGGGGEKAKVLKSWVKALDLLTLHVLPRLGEWEAAGDFVRLQGVENGGWVPDERTEASLRQLDQLQREEAEDIASRAQRQRDLELSKASEKARRRATEKEKGKTRASSSPSPPSSISSPGKKSPSSPKPTSSSSESTFPSSTSDSQVTGFAALRSSLSTYLARPASSPSSSSTTTTPTSTPLNTLTRYFQQDPIRLLSILCFGFALTTWLRRVRRRGGLGVGEGMKEGVKKVVEKLGEVVRMGTKVTQL